MLIVCPPGSLSLGVAAGAGCAEGIGGGGNERLEVAAEVADVAAGRVDETARLEIARVRKEREAASAQAA